MHLVIDASEFWRRLGDLRAIGASAIVALRPTRSSAERRPARGSQRATAPQEGRGGTFDGGRSAAPVSLHNLEQAVPGERRRVPQPVERGVGGVGEAVLEPEVVAHPVGASGKSEPAGARVRVHVPRDPLRKGEVDVGRRAREALRQAVVRAQQHLRELEPGARLGELPVAVGVLEVPARDPQQGATVDDVGGGTDERVGQVFVDLEVDLDAGRKPDQRGGLFDETRDHRDFVREQP